MFFSIILREDNTNALAKTVVDRKGGRQYSGVALVGGSEMEKRQKPINS